MEMMEVLFLTDFTLTFVLICCIETVKLHFYWYTVVLNLLSLSFYALCLLQSVRKCFALSSMSGILKSSAGALMELFRQDHRVTLHFITTLLGEGNMHQYIRKGRKALEM